YRELDIDGFVRSRGRSGTVVVDRIGAVEPVPQRAIDDAVAAARRSGLSGPAILDLVSRSLARG
ncbi:MAG: hypothetical protein WBP59_09645, partial [Ilumatobacteraceae bacterium]